MSFKQRQTWATQSLSRPLWMIHRQKKKRNLFLTHTHKHKTETQMCTNISRKTRLQVWILIETKASSVHLCDHSCSLIILINIKLNKNIRKEKESFEFSCSFISKKRVSTCVCVDFTGRWKNNSKWQFRSFIYYALNFIIIPILFLLNISIMIIIIVVVNNYHWSPPIIGIFFIIPHSTF